MQSAVNSDAVFTPILGIYVMGSFGSISQTSASDLDIWICHQDDLSEQEQQRLAEKTKKISQWASTFHVEMHFYLMTQQRFRNERYSDPLTKENSGSAQYMLLLEEFIVPLYVLWVNHCCGFTCGWKMKSNMRPSCAFSRGW